MAYLCLQTAAAAPKIRLSAAMAEELKKLKHDIQEYVYRKNKYLRKSFRGMDADGSGELSLDEFKHVLKKAGVGTRTPAVVFQALFQEIDSDSDGTIDFNEFARVLKIDDSTHYGVNIAPKEVCAAAACCVCNNDTPLTPLDTAFFIQYNHIIMIIIVSSRR